MLPTCLLKFSAARMNLLVATFFFLIGWPIAIWFDTDLSKTNHKGAGTRQLALLLARRGFWMEDFTFSPGQHLQNRAETGTKDFCWLLEC